jgi:hypothetical protein
MSHTTQQQTSISLEEGGKGDKIIWKELIELQAPRNCLGLTLLCETERKKKIDGRRLTARKLTQSAK